MSHRLASLVDVVAGNLDRRYGAEALVRVLSPGVFGWRLRWVRLLCQRV